MKEGTLQHNLDNRKILNGQFNMRVCMELFFIKQSKACDNANEIHF